MLRRFCPHCSMTLYHVNEMKGPRACNSIDITDCILSESAIYCNKIQHFYAPLEKSGCCGDL